MISKDSVDIVVCVGAQKAATSSLHSLMAQHSQVSVTNIKETGFFFRDELYLKGFDWYLKSYFSDAVGKKVLFEADPNYMCFPVCLDRLRECGAVSKVIVMLRNPVERLISSYMMMQRYELEDLSFEDAIRTESQRIKKGVMERETFNYIERSMYAKQIEAIFKRFSKEQVLFILFEDFVKNQEKEFSRVQSWLGLSIENCEVKKENASFSIKSRMLNRILLAKDFRWLRVSASKLLGNKAADVKALVKKLNQQKKPQTRPTNSKDFEAQLYAMFQDDIMETERLTGLDLSGWLQK